MSAAALHLDGARYEAVLRYLFDRSIPDVQHQEWYWQGDLEPFEATPLEWTRFQTLIFANAAVDVRPFSNDQVGMGLTYLMNNGMSDVPYAAISESVPLGEAMRMMRDQQLWQDALWHVFDEMLKVPCRGSSGRRVARHRSPRRNYAEAARKGMVQ